MSIGTGCGAWLGGLLLSTGAGGQIDGYGFNGWVAVVASLFCVLWIRGIKGSDAHGDPSMPHQACAPGETERT